MATIKLTAGGSVVLKGGKPSCTCCGPCSPDVATVYVEYTDDPLGSPTVSYFEMTGGLNAGLFEGTAPTGYCYLQPETEGSDQWVFFDSVYGQAYALGSFRCDPQGDYEDNDGTPSEYFVTVSFTALP